MKPVVAFVVLLLASSAIAQEDAPIQLSVSDHSVATCRGKDSDSPGCVTAPRPIYSPDPTYPEKARKKKQRGTVLVALVVNSDGLTKDVAVERGVNPELDEAATDAVKRWKFTPASKDGKPVNVKIKVEVSF